MNQKGFSLIECMVYSVLFSIMATTWFHALITMQQRLMQQSTACNILTEMYAAHDACIRDLRMAPRTRKAWVMLNNTYLVWCNGTMCVGWQIEPGKLIRYQGTYNPQDDTWHTYKKSIVSEHIDTAYFSIEGNHQTINMIAVTLHQSNCTVERKVYLHA
ncbi:MAG TPA: prepilin-type N-terminal cleavage/methylation domain-containing protein [Candidatus Dependentiae bacterium]|nr:prepilin-type N-terminal cleavage/methylation domain-containing protein [Candidatus Dependentiae bacterium]HRQ62462.1 prepilin-type N-terminal cleavage/methylation domain-containing protein [Candidatus Dependentiae bacterium]